MKLRPLQRDIKELQSRNAKSDYDRLVGEAKALELERGKLNAERERIHGKVHAKDDSLEAASWKNGISSTKMPKRSTESHKSKSRRPSAAIEDIGNYGNALDKAVMRVSVRSRWKS